MASVRAVDVVLECATQVVQEALPVVAFQVANGHAVQFVAVP